jgi:hypothetical protein
VKKTTIILLGVSLLVVGGGAVVVLTREKEGKPIASMHRYVLSEQPKALTDELAVSYARQALGQDGLNTNAWQPVHDGRLAAWGRSTDGFGVRNTNNSNHVCIAFRSDATPLDSCQFIFSKVV